MGTDKADDLESTTWSLIDRTYKSAIFKIEDRIQQL